MLEKASADIMVMKRMLMEGSRERDRVTEKEAARQEQILDLAFSHWREHCEIKGWKTDESAELLAVGLLIIAGCYVLS